jgi:ribosomal protein S18 acetylase RimI-like enzyme
MIDCTGRIADSVATGLTNWKPNDAVMSMSRMTPSHSAASGDTGDAFVRPYRAADGASLRDCIAELQDAERSIDGRLRPGRAIASDYLDGMLEDCRRYVGQVFVLEVDGNVAGFTTVFTRVPFERLDEPPGDYAIVAELLVRRDYRRRGYARALLAHGERYAAAHGAAELRIGVLSENTAARTLYLDFGFKPYLETFSKSSGAGGSPAAPPHTS